MNERELRSLIAGGETDTVEFKSDRSPLPDHELIETVVCLANYHGGVLLLGVEDDGRVTGLHPNHQTKSEALAAFISARTHPPMTVSVEHIVSDDLFIAMISIPPGRQITATSDGRIPIRYMDTREKPGCRPLFPDELINWRAERGLADYSALPVADASWEHLDSLEFARMRRMIEENFGDGALLELDDKEIARALGLTIAENDRTTPTVAGLLLVGKEAALRYFLPAHEVAFQVLKGLDVAINEFHRWPLLRIHEWLTQSIDVRNEEIELMSGLFRVGVPRYGRRGIREAIHNALIHRDFTRQGAVHIQIHDDYVEISNPGGFVVGVNPGNIISSAPRPRNPVLADAFKRIGLVERTGRGVSIIYLGQLQNGRRPPSYAHSNEASVVITLDSRPADLEFVKMTLSANRQLGRALQMIELAALWLAWKDETPELASLAELIQQDPSNVLERLTKYELLQTTGGVYRLDPAWVLASQVIDEPVSNPEEVILEHVHDRGRITRGEAAELCRISLVQASYILKKLLEIGQLQLHGKGRYAYYTLPSNSES